MYPRTHHLLLAPPTGVRSIGVSDPSSNCIDNDGIIVNNVDNNNDPNNVTNISGSNIVNNNCSYIDNNNDPIITINNSATISGSNSATIIGSDMCGDPHQV